MLAGREIQNAFCLFEWNIGISDLFPSFHVNHNFQFLIYVCLSIKPCQYTGAIENLCHASPKAAMYTKDRLLAVLSNSELIKLKQKTCKVSPVK